MTWVKICGTTNLEDALVAIDAGADAVGFVFYEKSTRKIALESAREIVAKLPENIETVGVFAGESLMTVPEVGVRVGLDSLQLYPFSHPQGLEILENAGFWPPLRRKLGQPKLYLAVAVSQLLAGKVEKNGLTLELADPEGKFAAVLLDSGSGPHPGGTGVAFAWNQAAPVVADLRLRQKVVIAGGLTSQNVGEAISILRPWGVDVASGVEESPGKKSPEKLWAFVKAVRETEGKTS